MRQLADDAAAILGKTRTEFMIASARREAIDVLLDHRSFVLHADRYDAFLHALDNPPAKGAKIAIGAAPGAGLAEIEETPEGPLPALRHQLCPPRITTRLPSIAASRC